VPKSVVTVVAGHAARLKTVAVAADPERLRGRLAALEDGRNTPHPKRVCNELKGECLDAFHA